MPIIRHLNLRSSLSLLLIIVFTFMAIMIIENIERSISTYGSHISLEENIK